MKFLKSILLAMAGMSITMQTIVAEYHRQEYLLETGWMFTCGEVRGKGLPHQRMLWQTSPDK